MKKTFYAVAILIITLLSIFSQTACFKPLEKIWYGKPTGFEYYISSGEGTTQMSKSGSTVVKGITENDKTRISFRAKEEEGSAILTDYDWTGVIDGELHREIAKLVENSELEDLPKPTPMRSGGGWNVFEVKLLYQGGKERKGLPVNAQEWHKMIEKIEQMARENKS